MGKSQERLLQMEQELYITDEHHVLNSNELQERIDDAIHCGKVHRTTVYHDIEVFQQITAEVVRYSARLRGYFFEHKDTPLDYLFLSERVAQSRILTETDIERINELIDRQLYPDARELLKSGYMVRFNRMSPRGDVCYSMSVLITAIEQQKRVTFQYEIFDSHFNLIPKHDGQWYDISCYRFHVDGNSIYIYAGDTLSQSRKTFRVEKMRNISLNEEGMEPMEKYYGSKSNEEISRQVNESAFHFNGELTTLRLIVKYEPFIMDVLWELSKGTAKTVEDISPGVIRVEFAVRKSDPLIRKLVSYVDLIRVDEPKDVADEIRHLLRAGNCTYQI